MPGPGHPPEDDPDDDAVLALAERIFDLARAGETDTLAGYLDAGTPVDLTNGAGDTLLMLAAYHGHPATVAALLGRGADPGRVNDRGQTPLAGAVFRGERAVVETLVAAGADPLTGSPSALATAELFGRSDLRGLLGSS